MMRGEHRENCTIHLVEQYSMASCTQDQTFGCHRSRRRPKMWVSDGCRGRFSVEGLEVRCEPVQRRRFTCRAAAHAPPGGEPLETSSWWRHASIGPGSTMWRHVDLDRHWIKTTPRPWLTARLQSNGQPGKIQCPPNCEYEPVVCPPRCSGWMHQCPDRDCSLRRADGSRGCEPVEAHTNRTLHVLWAKQREAVALPRRASLRSRRPLVLVTITYAHSLQLLKLEHCARALALARTDAVTWIVVEDAASVSSGVAALLSSSGVPSYRHLAFGPTRQGGNAQRNAALELIRSERLQGVVYQMDDDNGYHPSLWEELRALRPMRAGVLAVRRAMWGKPMWYGLAACDGTFRANNTADKRRAHFIERPRYNAETGAFEGFDAGWCDRTSHVWRHVGRRTFCVDMGGFAFDAALLQHVVGPPWNYSGHGGESELLEKLLPGGRPEDLQPLANCGQDVLVFHNEFRTFPLALWQPPARCGTDGWGQSAGASLASKFSQHWRV